MSDIRQRIVVRPSRPSDHHEGPFRKKRNSWDDDSDSKVRFLERALADAEKKMKMIAAGGGNGDLVKKLSDLERKNRKLERSLEDAEACIKTLKRKSYGGKSDSKDHVEMILEMTKSNKIMKNALEKGERRIKDLEEQINDSAEKVMDAYDTVGHDVSVKNKTLEDTLKRAEERIKHLETEKEGTKKTGLDSKTELILRRALEDAEKKVEHLEVTSLNLKEKYEGKVRDCKDEKNGFRRNLETLEVSVVKLEEQLKDKEGQVKLLDNELNIAKVTIKDKEERALALMRVKKLFEDGNVQENISSLSIVLKNIQDLSNLE